MNKDVNSTVLDEAAKGKQLVGVRIRYETQPKILFTIPLLEYTARPILEPETWCEIGGNGPIHTPRKANLPKGGDAKPRV